MKKQSNVNVEIDATEERAGPDATERGNGWEQGARKSEREIRMD